MSFLGTWLNPRIPDDSGKPVTLCRIDGVANLFPSSRRLPTVVHKQAIIHISRESRGRMVLLVFAGGINAGIAVLPGLMLAKLAGAGILGMFLFGATSAVVFTAPLITGIVLPISRRMHAQSLKRFIKSYGLCPSCAYDLRSSRSPGHYLAICPECGASWTMLTAPPPLPRHT